MARLSCALCVWFLVTIASVKVTNGRAPVSPYREERPRYTNSWAVQVVGGRRAADELARKHGLVNHGQVCEYM